MDCEDIVREKETVPDERGAILVVPGFVADTYSEIEASFVELGGYVAKNVRLIWVVPEISWKHNRFSDPANRYRLEVPEFVRYLKVIDAECATGNIRKWGLVSNILLFRKLFKKYHISAVYAQFGYERFWALFLGKMFGKVTIWHAHWDSLGTQFVMAKRFFYSLFIDHYIAVSDFIARRLPKRGQVHTVCNGVASIENTRLDEGQTKKECRRMLGIKENAIVILMVAAFTGQKRHALAVDICEQVISRGNRVICIFLGDGPERSKIAALIRARGLDACFVLPGHVQNVSDYYRAADLCIFTAYNDAAPFAVLEAMKYGLPIVAFNSGGVAEPIVNGRTGYLVDEGARNLFVDRVTQLTGDLNCATTMGQRGAEVIRVRYSRTAWLEQMAAVFEDIVQLSPHGSGHNVSKVVTKSGRNC
jgi:L-malate glycosyltransferase